MSVSPGGGTVITISSSGSLFYSCLFLRLLKEKEKGSKGRAIYWAVGS